MVTAHIRWRRRIRNSRTDTVETDEGAGQMSLPEKLPMGPARVEGWKSEKISGPAGSYSAVEIGVSVRIFCKQTKPDIEMAAKQCVVMADDIIDELYEEAHNRLIEHLEKVDT